MDEIESEVEAMDGEPVTYTDEDLDDLFAAKNKRLDDLDEALNLCMIGGNHLVAVIGNLLPKGTLHETALKFYGPGARYEAWCCWDAIMRARDIRDQARG